KLICGLSACKEHLGLTFFRGTELSDSAKLFSKAGENNTNIRSIRLTTLDSVNRAALRELLHTAVELDADPMIPPAPKVKREAWADAGLFQKSPRRQTKPRCGGILSPSCADVSA